MKAATLSEAGVSREILVIGSGFAAQQLVKSLRKLDAEQPIRLITADSGDEYNKPDLSHVVSRGCTAAAMTRLSGSASRWCPTVPCLASIPLVVL